MPLIEEPVMLLIIDGLARQYRDLNTALINLSTVNGYSYFETITATDDADVEIPMITPATYADNAMNTNDVLGSNVCSYPVLVRAIESHFNRIGFQGGLDQYLHDKGFRASDWFNQMYLVAKGYHLLATHVFCEADSLFGTVNIIAGPVVQFVDGVNYGTPWIRGQKAENGNFGSTRLKVRVISQVGPQCDLLLTGRDERNNVIQATVTIPPSVGPGYETFPVGYLPPGFPPNPNPPEFVDVGNVTYFDPLGPNLGSVGDIFEIRNVKDRYL